MHYKSPACLLKPPIASEQLALKCVHIYTKNGDCKFKNISAFLFRTCLYMIVFPFLLHKTFSFLCFALSLLFFSLFSFFLFCVCLSCTFHCCWHFPSVLSFCLSIPHTFSLYPPNIPLLSLFLLFLSLLHFPPFSLSCLYSHIPITTITTTQNHVSSLPVDISVSLLAVVVGFCGLALLVVSLFVFWKLCWPIWRSKALSSHADIPQGMLPEAPPANLPPPPSPIPKSPFVPEVKPGGQVGVASIGRQASQLQQDEQEERERKRKVPEVKVNGRSSVKLLEAAMKISQTSPDIPAEVQQALSKRLSKQAKIQRQTTEPTSSSRYLSQLFCSLPSSPLPLHHTSNQRR